MGNITIANGMKLDQGGHNLLVSYNNSKTGNISNNDDNINREETCMTRTIDGI